MPKHVIVHRGNPYDVHIQFFSDSLKNIGLSPSEIQQLQDVYSSIYAARLDYEASIASVAVLSPRETRIEIPRYHAFGEKLKQSAYRMFADILGPQKAPEVIRQWEVRMAAANRLWGAYPQVIQTVYDPVAKAYDIRHMVNTSAQSPVDFSKASYSRLWPGGLMDYAKFGPLFPKAE